MTELTPTVYLLKHTAPTKGTETLGVYANKIDALSTAHDEANFVQSETYPGETLEHGTTDNGEEYVTLGTYLWKIIPTEVQ